MDHYEDVEDETEYEGLHAELLLRQVSQSSQSPAILKSSKFDLI